MFLKLDRPQACCVVGGGRVAAAKLPALLAARARACTVVAPEIDPQIRRAASHSSGGLSRRATSTAPGCVVAAATPEVNREVAAAAEERRVFVNAVDDPASASAYLGGVVRAAA